VNYFSPAFRFNLDTCHTCDAAYVLDTVYRQNLCRSSLTFVGDGSVLVGFHLQTALPLATAAYVTGRYSALMLLVVQRVNVAVYSLIYIECT
jgi:hypothetical protein